jgi:hypothetical protein
MDCDGSDVAAGIETYGDGFVVAGAAKETAIWSLKTAIDGHGFCSG